MKWKIFATLLMLPLAIAGVVYGAALAQRQAQPVKAEGYICPLTGEELPCPNCCPLNQRSQQAADKSTKPRKAAEGYICPITGEELPCPNCCPLNQQK